MTSYFPHDYQKEGFFQNIYENNIRLAKEVSLEIKDDRAVFRFTGNDKDKCNLFGNIPYN